MNELDRFVVVLQIGEATYAEVPSFVQRASLRQLDEAIRHYSHMMQVATDAADLAVEAGNGEAFARTMRAATHANVCLVTLRRWRDSLN